MDKDLSKGEIVIYTSEDGEITLDAKLENDSIWLTQDMMSKLFDTTPQNITMHIKNVYEEEEVDRSSTCKDFLQVRKEGNRMVSRNLTFYNLDMILSIGYRIKSKVATKFRIWATNTLRDYLTKGYAINEKKIKQQQESIEVLKTSVDLLARSLTNQLKTIDDAQVAAKILNNFAHGLDLLDNFDHKTLAEKGVTKKDAVRITTDEFLQIIKQMKSEFASDVFGNPKDESFDSSVIRFIKLLMVKNYIQPLKKKLQRCYT